MALGSASSTVTVLLRDLGVFDVDFEGAGSAIIYDILTTAPLAGKGTAADDQPAVVTDDADALRLLFNRRAAGVQIEFQRLLRLALDISVADRLYGYEAAFVAASGTNSATVSKPATATATTTTTSTTASKGTTFLAEIALPSVDIVLAIPLAPMMQTARSHNARGWLQRPAYRQANVHCHLDDAHMTLRLGGAVTAADYHQDDSDRVVHAPHASPPSTPLPPSPPCMTQVELRARRVAVALKQTSDPRPVTLIVLNSDVGATAIAVDMRLQRPPVAPGKGIGRPVTEVSSPLGCARHDKNMSRSGLDKWLRRCASGARICINVKCDSMIADLPRARAEALVQLLLELGEWVPWSTLHHRALAAVAAAAASSAANAESMRRVETDSSWGDMDSHTTDSRQAQGPGLRRVRDSDDDTSTIPPDDDARTAAVTASAWSGLVKPHEAAMTIRSRRATVVLHEATVGDVITTTTCFKLQLEEALIAVGHGLGGSGHRALLLRGRHSSLMQVDPTLELAPPPHKHNQRAIYDVDATLRPRGTEPTAVDDVEEDDFAVAMLTQPASAHALTRVAFVLDFAQLCFQHFEDPRGHWLTRCLKLLSFPDPPDWPRPADRPPSILGLTVHFNHCAVLMEPMHKPLAGKLLLPQLHVGSNIASGTPLTLVEMHVTEARLLLIDDRQKLRLVDRPLRPQELLWAAQGWQSVVDAEHLHLTLRFSDSPNHTALSVALTDWTVTITTCADSFVTLLAFASALVDDKPPSNGEAGDGGNGAGNKVSNSDMSSTAIELQHIPRGWSTAAGSMAGTMAYSSAVSASSAAVYASAAPLPVVHTPPQLRLTSDALRAHEQQHQQLFGRGQHLSATQNAGGAEAAAEGEGEEEDEEEEAAASNSSTSAIEDDEEEAFQSAEEGSDDDNNAQQTDNSGVEAPPAELAHGRSAEASADASLLDSSEVDVMPAPPAALLITTVSQDMRDAMSSTGSAEPTPKTVPKGGFVFDLDEDYFAHSQTPANSTFSESSAAAAAPTAGARTGGARHSPIFQDAHEVVFGEEFPSSLAESLREASHSPSPERAQLGAHADSATARRSSAPAAQPRLATVAGGNVRSTSTSSAATAASASTPTVTTPQLATITYLGQPDRAVNVLTDYFQPPPPQYDADLK